MKGHGSRRLAIIPTILFLAGCSSTGDDFGDQEVIRLCEGIIAEIEAEATAEQQQALQAILTQTTGLDVARSSPLVPGDSWTLEPSSPSQWLRMYGVAGLLNGQVSLGLWASAQAARRAPSDPVALSQLAVILLERKRCEDARRLLEKARHDDPSGDELVRLSLASAYACEERPRKVVEMVEEASSLAPDREVVRQARLALARERLDPESHRERYLETCGRDIDEALHLESTGQLTDFTLRQSQESQTLTWSLLELAGALPSDLPADLLEDLSAVQDAWTAEAERRVASPSREEQDRLLTDWMTAQDAFAQAEASCCQQAAPAPCCNCLYDYCTDNWTHIRETADPAVMAMLERYTPEALRILRAYEDDLLWMLVRHGAEGADWKEWALGYGYGLLASHCKAVALQIANLLQPSLQFRDWAEGNCKVADDCYQASLEARIAEERRRAAEAREAALEAARRKAEAAQAAVDLSLRGEVCLDGIACLGVDGSQVSLKLGAGEVFTQFSVDVERYDVGVRVGVGIGDPTGNLWGADLSLGGTVGPSGTSFDLSYSESAKAGTVKKEVTLFKGRFRF